MPSSVARQVLLIAAREVQHGAGELHMPRQIGVVREQFLRARARIGDHARVLHDAQQFEALFSA